MKDTSYEVRIEVIKGKPEILFAKTLVYGPLGYEWQYSSRKTLIELGKRMRMKIPTGRKTIS